MSGALGRLQGSRLSYRKKGCAGQAGHQIARAVGATVEALERRVLMASAPSYVAVMGSTATSISLQWATSSGATSYVVLRKLPGGSSYQQLTTTTNTNFTDSNLQTGGTYSYEIEATDSGGTSGPSSAASATINGGTPAAPTLYLAGTTATSASLTWSSSTGATSYTILRKAPGGSSYQTLSTSSNTSYTDSNLQTGGSYAYEVQANNSAGSSPASNAVTASITGGIPPTPSLSVMSSTNTSITLSWTTSAGATSYILLRLAPGGSSYQTLTSTSGNSYTDSSLQTPGTYSYEVQASNASGTSSASAAASATIAGGVPATPTLSVMSSTATSVTLSWTSSTNATSYTVLRKRPGDTSYSTLTSTSTTSISDTNLQVGGTYSYEVQASGAAGSSAVSSPVSATIAGGIPAVPTPSIMTTTATSITLSWTSSSGATSYIILRQVPGGSGYQTLTTTANNTYTDSNLQTGGAYSYEVQATNSIGTSAASTPASATIAGGIPPSPTLSVMSSAATSINLAWNSTSGAASYELLREAPGATTFTSLTTTASNSYADTNLQLAGTYAYEVEASNAVGTSPASSVVSATIVGNGPSALIATVVSSSEVDLRWTAAAATVTQYHLERSTDGTTFTELAANILSTSYADTTVQASTTYWYRVRSDASGSYSAYASAASVKTPKTPVAQPSQNFVVEQQNTAITLDVLPPTSSQTISTISTPSHGVASGAGGSGTEVVYTPPATFAGADSFSVIAYDADGNATSTPVTVVIRPGGFASSTPGSLPGSRNVSLNDNGFVVGAGNFVPASSGSYHYSLTEPVAVTSQNWTDNNGNANRETTSVTTALSVSSSAGTSGAWSYSESVTILTGDSIVPLSGGSAPPGTQQSVSSQESYQFSASGSAAASSYSFSDTDSHSSSGSARWTDAAGLNNSSWTRSGTYAAHYSSSYNSLTSTSSVSSDQNGSDGYGASTLTPITETDSGVTVTGVSTLASSGSDSFDYGPGSGTLSNLDANQTTWSASGSNNVVQDGGVVLGTVNASGRNATGSSRAVNYALSGSQWTSTGAGVGSSSNVATSSVVFNGGFGETLSDGIITGATQSDSSSNLSSTLNWSQALGGDGNWSVGGGSGDNTSASRTTSTYLGSGSFDDAITGGSLLGNRDIAGHSLSNSTLDVQSSYTSGSWVDSASSGASTVTGDSSSSYSGNGSYTVVDTTGVTTVGNESEAGTDSTSWGNTLGQMLGGDGQWSTSSGSGNSSDVGSNSLNWGDGSTYVDSSSGSINVTQADSGDASSTWNDATSQTLADASASWSPTSGSIENYSSNDLTSGYVGSGVYSSSLTDPTKTGTISGPAAESGTTLSTSHQFSDQTLGSDGTWTFTGGSGAGASSSNDYFSYSASGAYGHDLVSSAPYGASRNGVLTGHLTQTADTSSNSDNNYSQTINSSGAWNLVSGAAHGTVSADSSYNYSETGTYTDSYQASQSSSSTSSQSTPSQTGSITQSMSLWGNGNSHDSNTITATYTGSSWASLGTDNAHGYSSDGYSYSGQGPITQSVSYGSLTGPQWVDGTGTDTAAYTTSRSLTPPPSGSTTAGYSWSTVSGAGTAHSDSLVSSTFVGSGAYDRSLASQEVSGTTLDSNTYFTSATNDTKSSWAGSSWTSGGTASTSASQYDSSSYVGSGTYQSMPGVNAAGLQAASASLDQFRSSIGALAQSASQSGTLSASALPSLATGDYLVGALNENGSLIGSGSSSVDQTLGGDSIWSIADGNAATLQDQSDTWNYSGNGRYWSSVSGSSYMTGNVAQSGNGDDSVHSSGNQNWIPASSATSGYWSSSGLSDGHNARYDDRGYSNGTGVYLASTSLTTIGGTQSESGDDNSSSSYDFDKVLTSSGATVTDQSGTNSQLDDYSTSYVGGGKQTLIGQSGFTYVGAENESGADSSHYQGSDSLILGSDNNWTYTSGNAVSTDNNNSSYSFAGGGAYSHAQGGSELTTQTGLVSGTANATISSTATGISSFGSTINASGHWQSSGGTQTQTSIDSYSHSYVGAGNYVATASGGNAATLPMIPFSGSFNEDGYTLGSDNFASTVTVHADGTQSDSGLGNTDYQKFDDKSYAGSGTATLTSSPGSANASSAWDSYSESANAHAFSEYSTSYAASASGGWQPTKLTDSENGATSGTHEFSSTGNSTSVFVRPDSTTQTNTFGDNDWVSESYAYGYGGHVVTTWPGGTPTASGYIGADPGTNRAKGSAVYDSTNNGVHLHADDAYVFSGGWNESFTPTGRTDSYIGTDTVSGDTTDPNAANGGTYHNIIDSPGYAAFNNVPYGQVYISGPTYDTSRHGAYGYQGILPPAGEPTPIPTVAQQVLAVGEAVAVLAVVNTASILLPNPVTAGAAIGADLAAARQLAQMFDGTRQVGSFSVSDELKGAAYGGAAGLLTFVPGGQVVLAGAALDLSTRSMLAGVNEIANGQVATGVFDVGVGAWGAKAGIDGLASSINGSTACTSPGNCFVAGTQVVVGVVEWDTSGAQPTIESCGGTATVAAAVSSIRYVTRPIETIRRNDFVLSRDQTDPNGPNTLCRVATVFERIAYGLTIVHLRSSNGAEQTLRTTSEHPIYVEGRGWVAGSRLRAGDELAEPTGGVSTVLWTQQDLYPRGIRVFNFSVAESHTYFVREDGSTAEPVWAHNAVYSPNEELGSGTLTRQEAEEIQAIANRYHTTIDVVGSRAKGEGRFIETELPVGDELTDRSDIDFRIDGGHPAVNDLIEELNAVGNGAGRASLRYTHNSRPTRPPFIRFIPYL